MLRTVISLVTVETRATVSHIKAGLGNLDRKMGELNSDVTAFNEFVKEQRCQLRALGEPVEDMVSELFVAYLTVDEKLFTDYIRMKESFFIDGTIVELSTDDLMRMAELHQKTLKLSNEWSKPESTKDQDFVAMNAKIDGIVKAMATSRKGGEGGTHQRKGNTFKRNDNSGKWACRRPAQDTLV